VVTTPKKPRDRILKLNRFAGGGHLVAPTCRAERLPQQLTHPATPGSCDDRHFHLVVDINGIRVRMDVCAVDERSASRRAAIGIANKFPPADGRHLRVLACVELRA